MEEVTVTIDGKELKVPKGKTIIEAAHANGIQIPHFCYHPGLSVDGNCRMCLVDVEKAPKPMIACNTQVADGMVVQTQSENVKKMRASVMEFILVNHPLDCPTCDQAGECRLQDYYMSYDKQESRFEEEKVEKRKMEDLGAGVMLDQERCIACSRCIRVCKEVAGVDELALANRGDHTMITTFPGKKMTNPYAGNTIDVCPVGALTNKDFRYKKRVWFLKVAPSICPGCSRGCNINIHQDESTVYRLTPRLNPEVNKYWMCDEGRYGYKFINEKRVLRAQVKKGSSFSETSFDQAIQTMALSLSSMDLKQVAVIGHANQTNETLKGLSLFAKDVLGSEHLYASRNNPENPSSDEILIKADKNPNQKGVEKNGLKPVSQLAGAQAALIVGQPSLEDQELIKQSKVRVIGLWLTNESVFAERAEVVLPMPTYAEQKGTFTNFEGREQSFEAAFAPKGESHLVIEALVALKEKLAEIKGSKQAQLGA